MGEKKQLASAFLLLAAMAVASAPVAGEEVESRASTSTGRTAPMKTAQFEIQGAWEGRLEFSGVSLRLVFDLAVDGEGRITGTMGSPDQGAVGIPLGSISFDGRLLRMAVPTVNGKYTGNWNAETQSFEGDWLQNGKTIPVNLTRRAKEEIPKLPLSKPDKEITGTWLGSLDVGVSIRIIIHVTEKQGALQATMDSPDQGAEGIPVSSISGSGDQLELQVAAVAGSFYGMISSDGQTIDGTWVQGGNSLPLKLSRTDPAKIEKVNRPQEPKPPFPYREEKARFANPRASIELAGTLTLPPGEGPFPAVALVSGSGPQDRNESLLGHQPFWVLADDLSRKGIAVLRYDDRGIGESGGTFQGSTTEDFASDAAAAIAYLKKQPRIDPGHIGLVGHSEGGLIAPMVAAQSADVAFIVMLAGPGVPGNRILVAQQEKILRANGVPEELIAKSRKVQAETFELLESDLPEDELLEKLAKKMKDWIANLTDNEKVLLELQGKNIEAELKQIMTPWFRFFLSYDPRPTLEKVRCPVLALGGSLDLQVPAVENLQQIEAALKKGGNDDVTTLLLPGLNHLFQTAKTGSPTEYAKIEETMAPLVLEKISSWIEEHSRPVYTEGE